jgi:antitoxin component HigA of HigAB toxin-antitoxin module
MFLVEKNRKSMKNKNWFFVLLLALAALSLAGTAAYFSVYGLTKLFYAAGLGITILAASLEFAKIITVTYVYRFWKKIKRGLRGFYVFAVIFIMLLTSVGIYGFLTGAYQKTANKVEMRDAQIIILENKKNMYNLNIERLNGNIGSASERIDILSGLRNQQETRLDTLYNRVNISSARRTEEQINSADAQIRVLNEDITDNLKQINAINDSILVLDQKIIEAKNTDVSNEIGPYQFVSNLTGIPMNRVVNIVALLIIVVFDPLAIALLIGINQLTMLKPEEEESRSGLFAELRLRRKKKEGGKNEEENLNDSKLKESESEKESSSEDLKKKLQEPEHLIISKTIEMIEPIIVEKDPEVIEDLFEEPPLEKVVEDSIVEKIEEPLVKEFKIPTKSQDDYDEFEPKKIASIIGKVNIAHFVPNN